MVIEGSYGCCTGLAPMRVINSYTGIGTMFAADTGVGVGTARSVTLTPVLCGDPGVIGLGSLSRKFDDLQLRKEPR
jgi:hypothetical protein